MNGQKVWNTLAHVADRGMLVARTDPELPKHKGLTYFMVDMHAPGVEVRPLRQITGEAEFNEVYLTDVRIADADRIGDVGDGWRVSMTTLMNERTTIGGAGVGRRRSGRRRSRRRIDLWSKQADKDPVSPRPADEALDRLRGAAPDQSRAGREAASRKSRARGFDRQARSSATVNKDAYELCIDLLGADGIVDYDYTFRRPDEAGLDAPLGSARKMFLRSRANSIEGGTSEIMRNILGERILGLPGEPRVDRDLPWSQVPRS